MIRGQSWGDGSLWNLWTLRLFMDLTKCLVAYKSIQLQITFVSLSFFFPPFSQQKVMMCIFSVLHLHCTSQLFQHSLYPSSFSLSLSTVFSLNLQPSLCHYPHSLLYSLALSSPTAVLRSNEASMTTETEPGGNLAFRSRYSLPRIKK